MELFTKDLASTITNFSNLLSHLSTNKKEGRVREHVTVSY